MKKIDLGQITTIVANAGIIASITFLAIEVHQNNEIAAAEARRSRAAYVEDTYLTFATDGDLASIYFKDREETPLTALERFRGSFAMLSALTNLEWAYSDMSTDEREVFARRWRQIYKNYSIARELWANSASIYFHPDFIQWFNENVVE